jgi:hypothetical protein
METIGKLYPPATLLAEKDHMLPLGSEARRAQYCFGCGDKQRNASANQEQNTTSENVKRHPWHNRRLVLLPEECAI